MCGTTGGGAAAAAVQRCRWCFVADTCHISIFLLVSYDRVLYPLSRCQRAPGLMPHGARTECDYGTHVGEGPSRCETVQAMLLSLVFVVGEEEEA